MILHRLSVLLLEVCPYCVRRSSLVPIFFLRITDTGLSERIYWSIEGIQLKFKSMEKFRKNG